MASSLRVPRLPKEKAPPLITLTRTPATCILLQMAYHVQEVKQLHAHFVVSGLLDHPLCARRLLESYVSMSQVSGALSIFERVPTPDVFTYNTMMRGLILGKCPLDSLIMYKELLFGCLTPDKYTYTFVLKACSHLKAISEGKQIHGQMVKAGIAADAYTHSSLINMYANSGSIGDAERVLVEFSDDITLARNAMISGYLREGLVDKARAMFDIMASKDVASWSTLITGYTKNGMHAEALTVFRDMMVSHIEPNESTLVSLLSACAHLGALHQGRWIHAYIDKIGFRMSTKLSTALIDMYAKCGSIECGHELFRKMPRRDTVTWGAMISGFAIYGQAGKCIELFEEMVADGVHPNEIIFVALLSACSHAGYVEEGKRYLNRMVSDFGIRPSIEHYGCMVDLFGRAGLLREAEKFIMSMPERPNSVIWGALLGACRTHKDLGRGRWAFRHLMELEPTSGDRYKQAGLMFANGGEKEKATNMRKIIEENKLETTCGSSFIEVDGAVHEFVVGDISHAEVREIYGAWEGLNRLLGDARFEDGYYMGQ